MRRGPRVLMTADAVGGVWRHALDLAREVCAGGGEVLLASMGPRPDRSQGAEAARIDGLTLVASDYSLEWMDDPWDDVDRAGAWLRELDLAWWPDVVHLNGYCHAAQPWSAPVVVAGHSCVASWWRSTLGRRAPAAWDVYRRRVRAGLHAADLVVAPTAAMLAALRREYGPLGRTLVVPNGVDGRAYRPGAEEPFAMSVGRLWDEAKNVRALAAVAAGLAWPIRVAGETAHPNGDRVDASLTGLDLLGPLPHAEVVAWLARAAIYVHPARYEPFGLSVLEAALSGCALVLADIPSLREVWGDAALYAPSDDHAALRRALAEVMSNTPLRSALAARALARGRRFGAASMARTYRRAYAGLGAPLPPDGSSPPSERRALEAPR